MKNVLLFSLMAGGLAFGAHRTTPSDNNLSERERVALKTSSPRVHLGHTRHKDKTARTGDRVTTDKTTVNAFVPYGK